jgi:hypothetical protein
MADSQRLDEIAAQLGPEDDLITAKWFGKPCIQVGGKPFVVQWGNDLAFKLAGEAHAEALQVEGTHLFDPRGQGHPMREWVQIPEAQSSTWERFARLAHEYVAGYAEARKREIITGLAETRRELLEVAASLSPAEQDTVFLGVWTARDLLAHLMGWDYANIEAVEAILDGRTPGFCAHYDRDWRTFNARLVAEYGKEDLTQLLSSIRESHQQLLDLLEAIPAEEFDKDQGVRHRRYKVTIARTIEAETRDEKEHCAQLKEFKMGPAERPAGDE